MLEVGCPDPADVLDRMESTRSCWPSSAASARLASVTGAGMSTSGNTAMAGLRNPVPASSQPNIGLGRFRLREIGDLLEGGLQQVELLLGPAERPGAVAAEGPGGKQGGPFGRQDLHHQVAVLLAQVQGGGRGLRPGAVL